MRKFLIFSAVGVVLITILVLVVVQVQFKNKKSHSPEEEVFYSDGELKLRVFYNRPYKKNREIFGGLVPYGKVWRTGANEATIFETNRPLLIKGETLPAGKYSLFTIPGEQVWTVIFNSEWNQWCAFKYDAAIDVLRIQVHVEICV